MPASGATADDDGYAVAADPLGQLVVVVQGEQEHAVDVLAGEVLVEAAAALRGLGEQQHQLPVRVGERRADAADDAGEERLPEDAAPRTRR